MVEGVGDMRGNTVVPPVVCVVGSSGAGKTTLLVKLIGELRRRGFKVGSIKHDVHGFEIDKPGKDSYRLKHAGAAVGIISSPTKVAIVMDTEHDLGLAELLPFYSGVDIVLAEGYKRENYPKVEVFRKEVHPEPLCLKDENLVAVVTAEPMAISVPMFGPDEVSDLAGFLVEEVFQRQKKVNSRV